MFCNFIVRFTNTHYPLLIHIIRIMESQCESQCESCVHAALCLVDKMKTGHFDDLL